MTVLTATLHVCSKHKLFVVKCQENGEKKWEKRGKKINSDIHNKVRHENQKDMNQEKRLLYVVEWQVAHHRVICEDA